MPQSLLYQCYLQEGSYPKHYLKSVQLTLLLIGQSYGDVRPSDGHRCPCIDGLSPIQPLAFKLSLPLLASTFSMK
jgi:hypothetical protein